MLSSREREKTEREEIEEMNWRERGERKMNESEETEEIKTFPSTFTGCKDSRPLHEMSKLIFWKKIRKI